MPELCIVVASLGQMFMKAGTCLEGPVELGLLPWDRRGTEVRELGFLDSLAMGRGGCPQPQRQNSSCRQGCRRVSVGCWPGQAMSSAVDCVPGHWGAVDGSLPPVALAGVGRGRGDWQVLGIS
jgi:hypothetical protein